VGLHAPSSHFQAHLGATQQLLDYGGGLPALLLSPHRLQCDVVRMRASVPFTAPPGSQSSVMQCADPLALMVVLLRGLALLAMQRTADMSPEEGLLPTAASHIEVDHSKSWAAPMGGQRCAPECG
jgi:hypothetical protein